MPIKKVAKDKDTFGTSVFRSLAMALNPGRYISIENGASAAKLPSINIKRKDLEFAMMIFRRRKDEQLPLFSGLNFVKNGRIFLDSN